MVISVGLFNMLAIGSLSKQIGENSGLVKAKRDLF